MSAIQIFILAVVQGIAEFLPISSSGHLVIVDALMGTTGDIADVNIVLHAGTLLSIVVFYWRQLIELLRSDKRVIPLLIVGTLPVVVIGLIVKKKFDHLLQDPLLAGFMLLATGAILWISARAKPQEGEYQDLSYRRSLQIGLAQSVAVMPGISRSGTTISAGMLLGLSRTAAATFSFLLAIPAIGGACVLEIKDLLEGAQLSTSPGLLTMGAVTSFVVGLVSLAGLLRVLQNGRWQVFAYWCFAVGLGVIIWQLMVR